MYDSVQNTATSKLDDIGTTTDLICKPSLHLDVCRTYYAGKDINFLDLEKENINGPLLMTGRTLIAMAKKSAQVFRKTNSYAEEKWEMKNAQK